MPTIKISKYLSEAGIASRRKAESLVKQGLVSVNGKKMVNVAKRIDPKTDKIEFDGKPVVLPELFYYMLNKPAGYTSTTEDKHADKLITDLVPKIPKVWPVGRLDKYTTGLILLTNDGDLTQKLTHPRYEVEKEYEITASLPLTEQEVSAVQRGVKLVDGFIKPDRFEALGENRYRIIIHSGKKHVVRRIIEKIGKTVIDLKRLRVGSLLLGDLPAGKWRKLESAEIKIILEKKSVVKTKKRG
jgi:23S rRNA pseudouridine2605 synthase